METKLELLKQQGAMKPNVATLIRTYERNIAALSEQLRPHDLVAERIAHLRKCLERREYASARRNVEAVIALYEAGDQELCNFERGETVVFKAGKRLGCVDVQTLVGPEVPRGGEGANWYEDSLGYDIKCLTLRTFGGSLNGFNYINIQIKA